MSITYFTTCKASENLVLPTATIEQFLERLNKKLPTYELTGSDDNETNLYFDIDIKSTEIGITIEEMKSVDSTNGLRDTFIPYLRAAIVDCYKIEPKFAIETSHGYALKKEDKIYKWSYRVYVPNIRDRKFSIKKFVEYFNKEIRKYPEIMKSYLCLEDNQIEKYKFIDEGVYDNRRFMRCHGTSKEGETRPLILESGELIDTVITHKQEGATVKYYCDNIKKEAPTISSSEKSENVKEMVYNMFIENKLFLAKSLVRNDWMHMGTALKTEFGDKGLALFHKFTNLCPLEMRYESQYVEEQFNSFRFQEDKPLAWNNIMKWAKDENPEVYKQAIDLLKTKSYIAESDLDAAKIIIEKLNGIIISYKTRMFLKKNNCWLSESAQIDAFMIDYILNSNIFAGYDEKKNKFIPYAQNITKAEHIYKAITKIIHNNPDVEFYNKLHTSTKGKICFKNGVLDFKTKQFKTWEECPDIYTCVVIPRDYVPSDKETYDKVYKNIFISMFGEHSKKEEKQQQNDKPIPKDPIENALHFLSRAIAGHSEDKNFSTYLGNRDCGKGVLYEMLSSAFTGYVNTFELANIMYNRASAGFENVDTNKKLYWLIDFEFCRLAISQETPDTKSNMKINGRILKKIAGGGDTIVARRNYDRQDTYFNIDTTWMMMGNNSIEYDTNDCLEHCIEFQSVFQFKTQEEIESVKDEEERKRYRVKDYNIKNNCHLDNWRNACVDILMNAYLNMPISINRQNDEEESSNLFKQIKEELDFSDKNAIMLVSDVYAVLNGCDKKKVEAELKSMNVFKKKASSGDFRLKWTYVGIKLKEIPIVVPSVESKN